MASDVRSFAKVAGETCPRQILRLALAAVLLRDDVIYMKGQFAGGFREETVFAAPGSAATNFEVERAA